MLARHSEEPFEEAVLQLPTVVLAAAIGEHVLRHYLRHVLLNLFGSCDELDGMIDHLIEMWNRRREMPIVCDQEYLDSWWGDFPPVPRHSGDEHEIVVDPARCTVVETRTLNTSEMAGVDDT